MGLNASTSPVSGSGVGSIVRIDRGRQTQEFEPVELGDDHARLDTEPGGRAMRIDVADDDPIMAIEGDLDAVVVLADECGRHPEGECQDRDEDRQAVAQADGVHAGTVAEAHLPAGSGESRNGRRGDGGIQATPVVDSRCGRSAGSPPDRDRERPHQEHRTADDERPGRAGDGCDARPDDRPDDAGRVQRQVDQVERRRPTFRRDLQGEQAEDHGAHRRGAHAENDGEQPERRHRRHERHEQEDDTGAGEGGDEDRAEADPVADHAAERRDQRPDERGACPSPARSAEA